MKNPNVSSIVAEAWDAWDRAVTLARYNDKPLAIGWYRGQAFIHMWDYRQGAMLWRRFKTNRPQQSPPTRDLFESHWFYAEFKRELSK